MGMLTETVKVALVNEQFVWVGVQEEKTTRCAGCLANVSCSQNSKKMVPGFQPDTTPLKLSYSARSENSGEREWKLPYETAADIFKTGDSVQIEIKANSLFSLAFLFYIMPLTVMIIALIVSLMLGTNELMTICFTFTGLAIGLLAIRLYSQQVNFKEKYLPLVVVPK